MLHDSVIRDPHAATKVRKGGRTDWRVDDPRVSVEMQVEGATLTFFFDREAAWSGAAPPVEVRLAAPIAGAFEPWRPAPRLPFYTRLAQAELAHNTAGVVEAIRVLRGVSSTRRGLSDDFLRYVALQYNALVEGGERYPIKALAELTPVDKSTASRWVSAARDRGLLV